MQNLATAAGSDNEDARDERIVVSGPTPAWDGAEATHAAREHGDAGAPPRRLRRGLWLLLVLACLVGVFGHSLWGSNDSRGGGMIWDMVRNGALVTPTLNGARFLEKPPLLHWTGVLICRLAGGVNEGLVRLPAALYGFGTLVLLYLLVRGRRDDGPLEARELAAWAAVFTCSTAVEFYEYSRVVLTDMALTFMVTLSLFAFFRAFQRPSRWRWLGFLVASAAAFYAKGLVGPALIWSAVAAFLLWKRRIRLLLGLGFAYLPILAAVVAPWVIALGHAGGYAALRFVFWDNQVGRFFSFSNPNLPRDPFFVHKEPLHFYIHYLPLYLLPWTLLLLPALVAFWRRNTVFRDDLHTFLRAATVGMFVLLHLSAAKVAVYALPVYPMLFAMLAIWLADLARRPHWTVMERICTVVTSAGLVGVFVLVPTWVVVGTFVRPQFYRTGDGLHLVSQLGLALAIAGLSLVFLVILRGLARSAARQRALALAPAAVAALMLLLALLATPVLEQQRTIKPFAALAARQARVGTEVTLATRQFREIGAFTFYLNRRLPNLGDVSRVPVYLEQRTARAAIVPRSALDDIERNLGHVPHSVVGTGQPGTDAAAFALVMNSAAWQLAMRHGIADDRTAYHLVEKTGGLAKLSPQGAGNSTAGAAPPPPADRKILSTGRSALRTGS
jgi:4-amino-4-deoxy-L-arabinose transferase-like glycosyltransferase